MGKIANCNGLITHPVYINIYKYMINIHNLQDIKAATGDFVFH